jgi:hypothetical protein
MTWATRALSDSGDVVGPADAAETQARAVAIVIMTTRRRAFELFFMSNLRKIKFLTLLDKGDSFNRRSAMIPRKGDAAVGSVPVRASGRTALRRHYQHNTIRQFICSRTSRHKITATNREQTANL